MIRRFLSLSVVLVCAGALAAHAQSVGQTGTSPQTTDCSNPLQAMSPACTGGAGIPGQTMLPGTPGQELYGNGTAAGMNPGAAAAQANPASPLGGSSLGGYVPTYVDQSGHVVYGYGYGYGAERGPYRGVQPPLTDFQHVVAGATGAVLPVYGADLFYDRDALFRPIDRVPVTSDYVVGPGDELLIRVWGQVNFNAHSTVDRSGDIYLPHVGNINVSGLHFDQLNGYLKDQLGHVFRNFDLSVNMGTLRSIQVYVVGNAQRPGSYTLSSLSTLVNALFFSGGPSEQGSMRRIELKRGGKIVTTFDFYDLLINGDKSHDAPLLPGDVIYIPPVGPQVAIAGSVHVPAIYELKGPETAAQAIALAGGFSVMASRQDAQLDRTTAAGTRKTVQLPLDSTGLATQLRDGDILRVPSMVQRFQQTVTLRGNVANPGRYRWRPGMRVRDLIPDQASLQTRGYWQRRIAMGLPAPEYMPLLSAYKANLPNLAAQEAKQSSTGGEAFTAGASVAQAQNEPLNSMTGAGANAPAATSSASTSANGTNSASSSQGKSSTSTANRNGNAKQSAVPELRYYPRGQRFSQGQFPIRNEVLRIAPSIDWSYAVIQRTNPHTLTTSLVPFNLGEVVLDHNAEQNLPLEPGDIVTVFSTADIHVPQAQQTKYVSIEGEVVHAGVYSVGPHETLRDLIRRAGGLTPQAYLYGSEFLRESTQRVQQARLTAYVNQLEQDIELASANAAGSVVNPTGASALGTSLQSQHDLIATLRKLRASGRIVLSLTPFSHGIDAVPNLLLQDGDRFIVPATPATVSVVGAVYDQNTFLYREGTHVGDYLKVAGGSTRYADSRHEFVIRADGSVISKKTTGGTLFAGNFNRKLMFPGDTVVVPDNVSKTSLLRNLTDYSAVLANFGVGVAAINLLK